jgi:2-isopropylmalate synthase
VRPQPTLKERSTMTMPHWKYRPYATVDLPDRTWPDRVVDRAPIWCSTDLRDGNQALVNPMDSGRKRRFFDLLLALGVPEIEVGFPSASKTDFDFVRLLIEDELIPDGTTIAVLTQARPELIERTFESIAGAERAIVHLYNSTSVTQRRVVFRLDKDGITDLAVRATRLCRTLSDESSTAVVLQYSPESFHHTELDYALEICEAVAEEWGPTPEAKMIVNLPTTVEQFPPNVYADRIEWFGRHFTKREAAILSVHPHNDRGTAVATAELGLMAGAERVEGTLFGNGERTGNVDLVTIALNLLTQGVDPKLDLSAIDDARAIVEECNELPVHPRHPYVGELVYTAFSGSHQDAIKKGMHAQERSGSEVWDVPYLPIDPKDVGRDYEAIIRVNSQSGKGGVAYLMQVDHRLELPRRLQVEFAQKVQGLADARGGELTSDELMESFRMQYLDHTEPFELVGHAHSSEGGADRIAANLLVGGEARVVEGEGNGPIDALVSALGGELGAEVHVLDYHEHAMSRGEDATAAAYVEADVDGDVVWGVGIHSSIVTASLRAVLNAVNRAHALRAAQAAAFDVP